ncbi:MAG: NADH-quinone oxidoreductase subunit H [Solirubrobacterales bacterium]
MIAAAAVQLLGGLLLGPLLVGSIQTAKARLQGRRGPSPLQPYRELRRLWGKSAVDPDGAGPLYELAPPLVAAATAIAVLVVPVAGVPSPWGFGDDAIVLLALLAVARFALTASAWDTGTGFGLMGAARDLTIAVYVELLAVLAFVVAAIPAASTSLAAMSDAADGWEPWSSAGHWCAAIAFAVVIVAETGRQPVDNPDTHLELTMIHEGPLLEYAGRDLALLQWSAAARHWIFLVVGAELFLPHSGGLWLRLGSLVIGLAALVAALAITETAQAKMRILRVPGLLLACS